MLDQAFETLTTYDWGADRNLLKPIDEAVVAAQDDPTSRAALEQRLAEVLTTGVSQSAKYFICRKLMVIGTAASVPTLAALLPDQDYSHMARYALERMPDPAAAQALRDALPAVSGHLKIGLIGSLGARRDQASVPALAALLGSADPAIARAAALALGAIRGPEAARALVDAKIQCPQPAAAATDAALACAEELLATGNVAEASAVYDRFSGADQPKHVRLAAARGKLACAGKKDQ